MCLRLRCFPPIGSLHESRRQRRNCTLCLSGRQHAHRHARSTCLLGSSGQADGRLHFFFVLSASQTPNVTLLNERKLDAMSQANITSANPTSTYFFTIHLNLFTFHLIDSTIHSILCTIRLIPFAIYLILFSYHNRTQQIIYQAAQIT